MRLSHIYRQYQQFLHEQATFGEKRLDCDSRSSNLHIQQANLSTCIQVNQFDSGILLSRFQATGQSYCQSEPQVFNHNLAFFFLMQGENHSLLDTGKTVRLKANELWTVQGELQTQNEKRILIRDKMAGIHCDFSEEKLQQWQEQGFLKRSHPANPPTQIQLVHKQAIHLLPFVQRLLQFPYGQMDCVTALEFEAVVLHFASKLLQCSSPFEQRASRSKIDDVIDIIHAEFTQTLTICELAKRVGLNECYLKAGFKQRTGKTISHYIREQRLNLAFELLSAGNSLQQTMYFTGYRHLGHFNQIFKAKFGCLPSLIASQ